MYSPASFLKLLLLVLILLSGLIAVVVASPSHFSAVLAAPAALTEFQQAQLLYNNQQIMKARVIMQKLILEKRATPEVYCLLADSYLLNDMDISDADLKICDDLALQALAKNPGWGNAIKIRGQVANIRGGYKQAIVYSTAALKAAVPDKRAYLQRCLAYQSLEQPEKALPDIEIYCINCGNEINMLMLKASVQKDLKRFDDAIATYKFAQKKEYRDWTVYRIVECYERMGKRKEALAEISALAKKNPKDAEAHYKQALQEEALGMNEEAIKSVTAAINNEPTPLFYRMRAGLYKKSGQIDKARADFAKSK